MTGTLKPKIVLTQDGVWPLRWRWEVYVTLNQKFDDLAYRNHQRMSGEAITKRRALERARRAVQTITVIEP